jgi:hypothetical protein
MTTELTCPTCGTASFVDDIARDAALFCRVCDYPLFWVRSARLSAPSATVTDTGLRRLPGALGRVTIATIPCPSCTEPNLLSANVCIRCGADMHPAPVIEEPPLPEPEPEPVVAAPEKKTPWWPWALAGALAVIAIVLIVLLAR